MAETATADAPAQRTKNAASLPFTIASRAMTRFSFFESAALSGAGIVPMKPIQIPAVGFLRKIELEVEVTATAGTGFPGDGPFNILSSVEFRTAAGNDLIVPVTGYQLMLMNKYGHPSISSPYSDPRLIEYAVTSGTSARFTLDLPFELDPETGWGSIPALASNRNYQLNINLSPYTVITAATGATVNITATAHYWSEPPATSASGIGQETQPMGLGTISQWQLDTHSVNPGDKYLKLNNTGNFMRNIIFVLRNAAGARIGGAEWPEVSELYLDNEPMLYLRRNGWHRTMRTVFGLDATGANVAKGLDTGVYVIPFDAFVGSVSGDPANSRSQYLPTLDSSQLQLRGQSFGAATSTVEILTNSVIPRSSADVYSK